MSFAATSGVTSSRDLFEVRPRRQFLGELAGERRVRPLLVHDLAAYLGVMTATDMDLSVDRPFAAIGRELIDQRGIGSARPQPVADAGRELDSLFTEARHDDREIVFGRVEARRAFTTW